MSLSEIPARFRPSFCSRCGCRVVPGEKWNQFVCTNPGLKDGPHEHWIQSPKVTYVVLLDEYNQTYLVVRGIPPAIGELCFPGGYIDFGDTAEETIVHETLDEACIRIAGKRSVYLGQWFEPGPGVTVVAFLVHIKTSDIDLFVPNTEATNRIAMNFWDMDPDTLAFNGNRLALAAARKHVQREVAFKHP